MTVNTKKLAGVSERPTTHIRPQSPEDLTESFRQLIYSNTKSRRVKDSPMFRKHNEKVKNLARQKKKNHSVIGILLVPFLEIWADPV